MSQAVGADRPKQRLSTPQTLHLMRLEVENAVRHGYPISCLMYGLDGFVSSDTMLLRKLVMPLVFQELKAVSFAREMRGLGVWTEGFQLAVFPHVGPDALHEMADALLQRARMVKHADVPASEKVSLSIGISHNLHPGKVDFESVVQDAESGMGMAHSAGGDRISLWREVESEIDRLREELTGQLQEIDAIQERVFGDKRTDEAEWGRQLIAKVVTVFDRETNPTAALIRVQAEVVALLTSSLGELASRSSATQLLEAQTQIENLERRISKLTGSLGRTEAELKKIAAMKDVDMGVASLYRTVQGLGADDDNAEAKHEMLKNIFEANLALRDEMKSKT